MTFRPELLDELLQGYENPQDLAGEGGILKQLTAALVERCLNAEMKTHLEEPPSEAASEGKTARNRRNGHSKKTIKGEFGQAEIAVPPGIGRELIRQQGASGDGDDPKRVCQVLVIDSDGVTESRTQRHLDCLC